MSYLAGPGSKDFVSAVDTTTQNIVTPGTFQTITFNTNALINGWTHTVGTDAFTVPNTGTYFLEGFAEINKTAGADSTFEFRITINGTPVGTVFAERLTTNGEVKSIAGGGILPLTAAQVVRVEWTGGANSQIVAPATVGTAKSAALSILRIG